MKAKAKLFLSLMMAVAGCKNKKDDEVMQIIASGVTGGCTWMLTGTPRNYTLTISGNGAMADYDAYDSNTPWYQYREDIKNVVIQDGVTAIGEQVFRGCSSLTSINADFANPQYSSKNGVLFNKDKTMLVCCPGGKKGSYVIPNSVITINDLAFIRCVKLTAINVDTTNTRYSSENSVLFNKDKTMLVCCPGGKKGSYVIPNSVTTIGEDAFTYCYSLTSVTIPNSVTTIGEYAFNECTGLTSMTIPSSVTAIGEYAFIHCYNSTTVTNLNPMPQTIESSVFFGVNISTLTLKVSASAVNDYKAAPVWSEFGNIIEIE